MTNDEIKDLFLKTYGKNLNTIAPEDDSVQDSASRLIERQKDLMISYCMERNVRFSIASVDESEFNKILVEQIYWVLNNIDFSTLAGYDYINNQSTSLDDLSRRVLSPNVKRRLNNFGYSYRGIK